MVDGIADRISRLIVEDFDFISVILIPLWPFLANFKFYKEDELTSNKYCIQKYV